MSRNNDTPAGALKQARADLVQSVQYAQTRLAEAIIEMDEAEKSLADANAKLKAMDEFIARALPGESRCFDA